MTTRFQALTRMCLNNWHYINEKVLTFNNAINFFTGHSGSGKSTVLDALQIVLYADSNGRGFFNKAAKEDSDRTLMEYLRGMKVVQDNDEASYLRNKNFSTSIVLEFQNTETLDYQSIGIVFDVDVSANDINRMFFWHKGPLAENHYRNREKVLSTNELKEYIKGNYEKEDYNFNRTNEKFRSELYSTYFGGLHEKHFPALFKKAIPFKMNMRLEDFVKNYICMENDIHMEDMQDSVSQYVRLKRRLEDTKNEISMLTDIHDQYLKYHNCLEQSLQCQYNIDKLDINTITVKLETIKERSISYQEDVKVLQGSIASLESEIDLLQKQRDEVLIAIENSGYQHLEAELRSLNQVLEFLYSSRASYDKIAKRLEPWLSVDYIEPSLKEHIRSFQKHQASSEILSRIQEGIALVRTELQSDKDKMAATVSALKAKENVIMQELNKLEQGQKTYPAYLLEVKEIIQVELKNRLGKEIPTHILADVIEVKDESWMNAVEGYMGNNKLALIVAPEYAKEAMKIYQGLDVKRYHSVTVVDTEKVRKDTKTTLRNSLAEEVDTDVDYVRAYVDYLLGSVIKCANIDELRENRSGITKDGILYQGYKLSHINPRNYTEYAYIGQASIERRRKQLQTDLAEITMEKAPLEESLRTLNEQLSYESFSEEIATYEKKLQDMAEIREREQEKQVYQNKIQELKNTNIDEWKAKKDFLQQAMNEKSRRKESTREEYVRKTKELEEFADTILNLNEELLEKQLYFTEDFIREDAYRAFMEERTKEKPESIKLSLLSTIKTSESLENLEYSRLVELREKYQKLYSYRGFSLTAKDNSSYDQLLDILQSDKLNEFMEKADEQAKVAVYHFKTDFVYKIRDAIKEVMQQKDDLNRILSHLDFGKDKYKFIISKNKGEDGKFYDMFMDENLEINPSQLYKREDDRQMNLFAMQHEANHGDLINELLDLFMPPESNDSKVLEEARANMEKYADYRTYLSFDMEQLVEGMPAMRLSKMLSKNSGGEGQNPLYVALLASFAQVYRISLKPNVRRRPTPRLVVLDEAFSKMDGEKVGSCIGLIRKLGFQAVISATNDKIQNYVDNVDKTFVFANPNKNLISIQEFEKKEFTSLLTVEDEEVDGLES